jgi:hypothetical protein
VQTIQKYAQHVPCSTPTSRLLGKDGRRCIWKQRSINGGPSAAKIFSARAAFKAFQRSGRVMETRKRTWFTWSYQIIEACMAWSSYME